MKAALEIDWNELKRKETISLFLDFDGTLVDLAETPDAIVVSNELIELLQKLSDKFEVHIVTGRSLEDLKKHLDLSALYASGTHGYENNRTNQTGAEKDTTVETIKSIQDQLSAQLTDPKAVLMENKGVALAVHYRTCPEFEDEIKSACKALISDSPALECLEGKCLVEIRPKGANKAYAVSDWLNYHSLSGSNAVFIGDDTTDEYGFEEVNKRGGLSIVVGKNNNTNANYTLPNVAAVHQTLNNLLASVS